MNLADEAYNNSHRAFVQAFFAHPTLTFEQARPILAKIESIQGAPQKPSKASLTIQCVLADTNSPPLS
jgi:hypothetical protein